MEYDGIEFFNVAELSRRPNQPGAFLERWPAEVRNALDGRRVARVTANCELRFVTESKSIEVTLRSINEDCPVHVFCGDYLHSTCTLQGDRIQTLEIERNDRFEENLRSKATEWGRYHPRVWRIVPGKGRITYHGIETHESVRPPKNEEVPSTRWLAYGSSITHGYDAFDSNNSYVATAARELGIDVLNMGMAGNCRIEKEAADYFAARDDWDLLTAELGVNVLQAYTVEEFFERSHYFITTIAEAHPEKPLCIVTIFPNHYTPEKYTSPEQIGKHCSNELAFNKCLRGIVRDGAFSNVTLVEGADILTSPEFLTVDLVHPSDYGMIEMGKNLARYLCPLLPSSIPSVSA
ncbi:MAG: SGNH/GDSL hydrolase family protein [Puniceicoccaceae bacterium]